MPFAAANDVSLYYEIHGQGRPLVLIAGLGYASWLWWKQLPALSSHVKVITFDNRGVGQSDKPDVPYSIPLYAADIAALLDALRIDRADIFGVSMGGYAAQEFALTYPERTARLILGCTSFGGPHALPPLPQVVQTFMARAQGEAIDFEAALAQTMSAAHIQAHPEDGEIIRTQGRANPQPLHAFLRQLMSPIGWSSEDRLSSLQAPTLIMNGTADMGSPVENARLLAAAIPQAKLRIFEGAGHLFFLEQADDVNKEILSFLGAG